MAYVNGDQPFYFRPTAQVIRIGTRKVFFIGGARVLSFYGDIVLEIINPLVKCLNAGSIVNNVFTDQKLLSKALEILNYLNSSCLIQGLSAETVQAETCTYLAFRFCPLDGSMELKKHHLNRFSAINFFLSSADGIFTGERTLFGVNYVICKSDEREFVPNADNICSCSDDESINIQFSSSTLGILDVHILESGNQFSMSIQGNKAIAGLKFFLLTHCILLVLAGMKPPKIIRRSYENSLLGTVSPDQFSGRKYYYSHELKERFGCYKAIHEICLLSAGTIFQNDRIRRISPSAGDLRTIHCVYLSNEIEDEIGVWVMVMGSDCMEKISVICDPDLSRYAQNTAGILLFSATAGGLRIKYKELAPRLTFYDTGITVGYAKRLANGHSMFTENLDAEAIKNISSHLSFLSKNSDNFISAGLVLFEGLKQDKHRSSHLGRDFWCAAMLGRRSVRQFHPAIPDNSVLDVLENRYLDVENVFSVMALDGLAPMLVRIQKIGRLDTEFKIRITNISTRVVDTSYSHISLVSSLNHIIRQHDLSLAPVIYLVAYGATPSALFPEELIWQFTSETLASLWLLAESFGLKGTLCGDTHIGALVNNLAPFFPDRLSLCLGLAPE